MKPCVFCQIEREELPSARVYEDDTLIALMDKYPMSPGHVLIISRAHTPRFSDNEPAVRQQLFALADQIAEAMQAANPAILGINWLLNDGKASNQTVPHTHLHLIPRYRRDSLSLMRHLLVHIGGLFIFGAKPAELEAQAAAYRAELTGN